MPRKKAKRKLNPRRLKATELYYIDELAARLGVHPNTIRNMIKDGMQIVEGSYPNIIRGQFAIDYINARQAKKETKSKWDEIYCLPCRKPFKVSFATLEITAPKVGNLKSICECNRIINRRISLEDLPKFQEVIKIQQLPNSPLIQGLDCSGICETKEQRKND